MFQIKANLLLLSVQFLGIFLAVERASGSKYTTTSFVPPAVPRRVDPSHSWHAADSQLHAKKKSSSPTTAKKVQVKLLKHIAGTGQAGQVIMVTPAFFNNKLRPSKSAVIISDEEVEREQVEATAEAKHNREVAEALKEKISTLDLKIKRKAGPDGQLFGGIGPKVVMQELQNIVGEEEFLGRKSVKLSLVDGAGKKIRGDIKHTGEFGATVALSKELSAKVKILVEQE